MNCKRYLRRTPILTGLALALALATTSPTAHANVYATNIKINGTLTGAAPVFEGSGATITYILNEPASLGLAIQIYSGATLVRTIAIAGGSVGTIRGLNSVVWDGKDDSDAVVGPGNYTVSITAGSNGYLEWTQINDPADPGYTVYWPSGIVVDTSTNSAYYGRIMVANGADTIANNPGIVKLNADGTYADEGPAGPSTAGYNFVPDGYTSDCCRSLKYGTDDRVYFNDWTGSGKIVACDMIMSTNQTIADTGIWPGNPGNWAEIEVTDPGTTNALAWFGDANYPPAGFWVFPMTNNGVADMNSGGFNVIANGPDVPVRSGFGLMIDEGGNMWFGSTRANATDASPKLTSVTNVWQAADGSPTNWWNSVNPYPFLDQNLNWQDGAEVNSTFTYSSAVAIDSRTNPKYVSQTFYGNAGGMKIINAADGTSVTNINQGIGVFYIGTCFDNVGNVYAGSGAHNWAAFSPPGSNQATTPAVVTMDVTVAPTLPHVTKISVSAGTVTIDFTGDASDPASAFTLLSSGTVNGTYGPATGAAITGTAGSYQATVSTSGGMQFYRIQR